jgi:hypothetical protein
MKLNDAQNKRFTLIQWLMFILWVLWVLVGFGLNFNSSKAFHALEASGFQKIEVQGYRFFGCGREDVYHRGFKAEMNGKSVTGTACSGYFKGTTIRID